MEKKRKGGERAERGREGGGGETEGEGKWRNTQSF